MKKTKTTLTIDPLIIQACKIAKINMSKVAEKALLRELNVTHKTDVIAIFEDLKKIDVGILKFKATKKVKLEQIRRLKVNKQKTLKVSSQVNNILAEGLPRLKENFKRTGKMPPLEYWFTSLKRAGWKKDITVLSKMVENQ